MIEQNIEYKGINSKSLDLLCDVTFRPILSSMERKTIDLSYKSGIIDFGDNKNKSSKIEIYVGFDSEDEIELRQKAREIASWLHSSNWEKLILWDEPDKYYLARIYDEIDLKSFINLGEATITFICQPFAYMVADTGSDDTWDDANYPWLIPLPWDNTDTYMFTATGAKSFVFDNPGTKETNFRSPQGSKFDIRINGSFTTLGLTLNGKTINYNQAVSNGLVTIDNVDMEVDLNGVNKLNAISGDLATFLTVMPGSNTISVAGTGLNIELTLDFSPMWL